MTLQFHQESATISGACCSFACVWGRERVAARAASQQRPLQKKKNRKKEEKKMMSDQYSPNYRPELIGQSKVLAKRRTPKTLQITESCTTLIFYLSIFALVERRAGFWSFFFFAPPLERNKTSDSRFSLLSLSFFPLFLITQTQQKNSGILYFKIEKHL